MGTDSDSLSVTGAASFAGSISGEFDNLIGASEVDVFYGANIVTLNAVRPAG